MHCSTDLGKKHPLLLNVAVQIRLMAAMRDCSHTYQDLLFVQVCNDANKMHCSTDLGKKRPLLLNVAVQIRLMAAM